MPYTTFFHCIFEDKVPSKIRQKKHICKKNSGKFVFSAIFPANVLGLCAVIL